MRQEWGWALYPEVHREWRHSSGLTEARRGTGVIAVKTGMMSGVWNMRLRGWALSLGQGRCCYSLNQKRDVNLGLLFWHVLGMCVKGKGGGL